MIPIIVMHLHYTNHHHKSVKGRIFQPTQGWLVVKENRLRQSPRPSWGFDEFVEYPGPRHATPHPLVVRSFAHRLESGVGLGPGLGG